MIKICKSLVVGFVTIALFWILQLIGALPFILFNHFRNKSHISKVNQILNTSYANSFMFKFFVLELFLVIILFIIGYFYKKENFKEEFKFKTFDFKKVPYIIFLGSGASLTLNIIVGLLFSFVFKTNVGKTVQLMNTCNSVFSIITMTILAPIAEELVFRGFLFNYFNKKHSTKLAIILSSLFFAIVHGDLYQGLPAFIIGIILANIYIYTDSIYGSILLHMVANATPIFLKFLEKLLANSLGNKIGTSIVGLTSIFYGIIFLFLAIYFFKKIECKKKRLKYLIFSILLILISSILIFTQFLIAK